MRSALVIAGKDLRQRLRDRSAWVIGLLAPIAIAALMSTAFRGAESFHFTLGLLDRDHGPLAGALLQALQQKGLSDVVTVRVLPAGTSARAAVRSGGVAAALVVPPGFSGAAATARPKSLTTLTDVDNATAGNITAAIASSFVAQLNADRLSVATALAAGSPVSALARLQALASRLRIPLRPVARPLGARELKAASYYSPAMGMFFLLFMIAFTSRSFFVDRDEGMVERMRAAPVRPGEILLGKALSVLVYGVISLGVIALVTAVAFGADWGDPLAASILCLALVLAVLSLTMLVITTARTKRQAEGIASVLIFGCALLGGNFVFLSVAPPLMRTLALATPNGWALRGLTDLATKGGGLATVVVPVVAIFGFSLAVGTVASLRARRAVSS